MIIIDDWDVVLTKCAGVAGAFVSMQFLQGSWQARLSMATGGAILSVYGAPHLSQLTSMPEGLTGFLTGIFGMAIVAKAWEAIQLFPVAKAWESIIDMIRSWKFPKGPSQ